MQISLNLFNTFGNLMPIAYGNFISLHIPFIFGISVIILAWRQIGSAIFNWFRLVTTWWTWFWWCNYRRVVARQERIEKKLSKILKKREKIEEKKWKEKFSESSLQRIFKFKQNLNKFWRIAAIKSNLYDKIC